MSDEKPTLEYGYPDPARKSLPLDTTITVLLAAVGLVSLSVVVACCRWMVHASKTNALHGRLERFLAYAPPLTYALIFTLTGSLLLWGAWWKGRGLFATIMQLTCLN